MDKIATREKMVEAIEEADKPFLTKKEIGEELGVSAQTITNNEEELHDDPRVASGKAGRAAVFYPAHIDEPPEAAAGGEHRGSEQSPRADGSYHLFERAAFYAGFTAIMFSLLLNGVFLVRLTVAAIAQWTVTPAISSSYLVVLVGGVVLLGFSGAMLGAIRSGVLRSWTADLSRGEVEAKILAAKSAGVSWTWRAGIFYAAVALVTGMIRMQFGGVVGDVLFSMAAVAALPLFATIAFTVTCYALLATSQAYAVYSLIKQHLPEEIPEQSPSTPEVRRESRA